MNVHVGDIIVLDDSSNVASCDNAREVVYVGPGLVCMCFLMYGKTLTTRGHRDMDIQECLYRKGDENETRK